MDWSHNDLTVMEQALKQAIAGEADYQAIYAYQEVLEKLKTQAASPSTIVAASGTTDDGIRYDYDDSSNLRS